MRGSSRRVPRPSLEGVLMSGQYRTEAVRTDQPPDRAGGALGRLAGVMSSRKSDDVARAATRAAASAAASVAASTAASVAASAAASAAVIEGGDEGGGEGDSEGFGGGG